MSEKPNRKKKKGKFPPNIFFLVNGTGFFKLTDLLTSLASSVKQLEVKPVSIPEVLI